VKKYQNILKTCGRGSFLALRVNQQTCAGRTDGRKDGHGSSPQLILIKNICSLY